LFTKLFSNIYFKISSLKQNIKTLPGDHNKFDENSIAEIRLEINEVELFLKNISSLIESGFEDIEVNAVISMIKQLRIRDEKEMHFNIFYNDELIGFTIIVYMLPSSHIGLEFVTHSELADQIQEVADHFENPPNKSWH
jgi:hypothetical protein